MFCDPSSERRTDMKAVFQAYWPSVWKHRGTGGLMLILMVVTVLAKGVEPFLLRQLLDGLMGDQTKDIPVLMCWIVLMFVTMNVAWFTLDQAIIFFEAGVMRDLDQRSFGIIQSQSMRFFENTFAGSLVTSARRFRNSFESITDSFAYRLGRSAIMIILTIGVFFLEYPLLALAFSIWIVMFSAVSTWFAWLRVKRDTIAASKDSKVSGALADSFSNVATVKSYAREREEQKRFNDVTDESYTSQRKAWQFGTTVMRVQGLMASSFQVVVLILLVRGVRAGTVTAGDFLFFQTYILLLMSQVWEIGGEMHKVFRHVADAKEMAEIYLQQPEVRDAPNARPLRVDEGRIEFHAVNFSYVDRATRRHHDVHDFTLEVKHGQTVALVGHSGAGKSTIVKLLLRHYDVGSGYILIDGQDVADVTQVSLRQQIAVVSQHPGLFHRTLWEILRFARPDASDEEVIEACKQAHAWDFVKDLPDGLNTLVGERGVKLSGGQRQRIALAQALLADARIVILDEATSALDSKTEYQIQEAIRGTARRADVHRHCSSAVDDPAG
jgi:ATP-binding cassette subfamily B protein